MPDRMSQISALLLERQMCLDCIGTKARLQHHAVEAFLAVMQRVVRIVRSTGVCDGCGAMTRVVSIVPGEPPSL
jgi:hypothetical protein